MDGGKWQRSTLPVNDAQVLSVAVRFDGPAEEEGRAPAAWPDNAINQVSAIKGL